MDHGDFDDVSWGKDPASVFDEARVASPTSPSASRITPTGRVQGNGPVAPSNQLGRDADPLDIVGQDGGSIICTVTSPLKENDGTKDTYISYLITTTTDFPTFAKPVTKVRRRFTDFVYLYKALCLQYPACAVPPIPEKHKMEYVRGDRFGTEFTQRRANSLHRFLTRITFHPRLRKCALFINFLESTDWNSYMRSRPGREASAAEQGAPGVFDNFADTFINAFTKVHKPDKRFIDVKEKSDKLDEDLGHVEKIIARVARREGDLETDLNDLAKEFGNLAAFEENITTPVTLFTTSINETAAGMKTLKEHTDHNYLGSLRDMQSYSTTVKSLLKSREQKQLDFEQLTEYLTKATTERDNLASSHGSSGLTGPGGFIRSKLEDMRNIDHEQSRRERVRKLEMRIQELTDAVEIAKKDTEAFDEEVVKEIHDFERIKRIEFKIQFSALADAHTDFYGDAIGTWEAYIKDMEKEGVIASA